MQKIGLKRDLRCINPCKSGVGSYLTKLTSPPKGGGRSGNFRGSKNQKSGKCHELSRQSIKFVFFNPSHPGGGFRGGWGSKFQKYGKFQLSRKSIKKNSERGRVERSNEWGGKSREVEARAKPGNQLIYNNNICVLELGLPLSSATVEPPCGSVSLHCK